MDSFSNEELARIIYNGLPSRKDEALSILCKRYHAALVRFATAYLNGDIHIAQDAVQETWIAFYKWAQKTETPHNVKKKLYSLTKYKCLEILRKERRYVPLLVERADYCSLETCLDLQHKKCIIRTFLIEGGLTKGQREVWIYRQLYELSPAEVGLLLHKRIGTVNTMLSNANRAWQQYLKTFYILPER